MECSTSTVRSHNWYRIASLTSKQGCHSPAIRQLWGRSSRGRFPWPQDSHAKFALLLSYDLVMSVRSANSTILSFEDARRVVEGRAALVGPCGTESVDLQAAAGRVLAEPVVADRDLPPFPRATRDGYAVRSADLSSLPTTLDVIGEIKAGETLERIPSNVGHDQAVSIMTGAPVPQGVDAVVMVEFTSQIGKRVEIGRSVAAGENVVPRGAEARLGAALLDSGTRLNEAAIGL